MVHLQRLIYNNNVFDKLGVNDRNKPLYLNLKFLYFLIIKF